MRYRWRASILLLVVATTSVVAIAQVARGRLVRGGAVAGGGVVVNPWWGGGYYGGYWGNPWGGTTAYGSAARGQAAMIRAQGQAQADRAKAARENEEARSRYLDNKAKYEKMRREQREWEDARKEQQLAERKEAAANRPPAKITDRYDRLPVDQLDPTTGAISWPESLQRPLYDKEREIIEQALLAQAEEGPSERLSRIIQDTADEMKKKVSSQLKDLGFEEYSRTRRFLGALSVEGYHELEGSR
jgi:hypothetical protein